MGVAVSITRLDLTASELRKAASGEKNSAAARIRCFDNLCEALFTIHSVGYINQVSSIRGYT